MKKYIVSTHLGEMETMAVSPKKALSNVKYRLFGGRYTNLTQYWTVREAE